MLLPNAIRRFQPSPTDAGSAPPGMPRTCSSSCWRHRLNGAVPFRAGRSAVAWLTLIIGPGQPAAVLRAAVPRPTTTRSPPGCNGGRSGRPGADLAALAPIVWAGPPPVAERLRLRLWPFFTASSASRPWSWVRDLPGRRNAGMGAVVPASRGVVAEQIDAATSAAASLWINRLVLSGIDLADRKIYDTTDQALAAPVITSVRGRHLEGAVLIDAVLPRTDFTNAHLEGAVFTRADLQGRGSTPRHDRRRPRQRPEQGASLFGARWKPRLSTRRESARRGHCRCALWAPLLNGAQLQGVSLAGADLRGVSLAGADLRGANLAGTCLQGASFQGGDLAGASLKSALVWRTDFRSIEADKPGFRVVGPATHDRSALHGPGQGARAPPEAVERCTENRPFRPGPEVKDLMLGRFGPPGPRRPIPARMRSEPARIGGKADGKQYVDEPELHKLWRNSLAPPTARHSCSSFLHTLFDEKAVRFRTKSPD